MVAKGLAWSLTGHRPNKFGNDYDGVFDDAKKVRRWLAETLEKEQPSVLRIGMALGVDTWGGLAALDTKTPFTACVPFEGMEKSWPQESQARYRFLLSKAEEIVIVNEGEYRPWFYQRRNEYMVNHSAILAAVWNGTSGGTWNTVKYARKIGHPILYYPGFGNSPHTIEL